MISITHRHGLQRTRSKRTPLTPRLGIFEPLECRELLATVTLQSVMDTTLIEDAGGSLGNGASDHIFVGRTAQGAGQSIRRGLLAFDIASSVPAGAVITGASLQLNMSMTIAGPADVSLHTVNAGWGEGGARGARGQGGGAPAQPNDATWLHGTFNNQNWAMPGGDFSAATLASTSVGGNGSYVWSSAQMAADVQRWLDTPAQNFGWLLRGDESAGTTAKRFDAKENPNAATRPQLTIDFDLPVATTLSISDAQITEGDAGTTVLVFDVSLSDPPTETVTVDFATQDGTATAGLDYESTTGQVTFPAGGGQTQTIEVVILNDTMAEPDESFQVTLSNAVGAEIETAVGTGTIIDNDSSPTISVVGQTVTEGDDGNVPLVFTVTLSGQSGQTISVDYSTQDGSAVAGSDFVANSGTVTFFPGETTRVIEVSVIGDTEDENDEAFTIQLTNSVNATIQVAEATGTILDDDEPSQNPHPWQNDSLPEDTNNDGVVVPLDALLVINDINDNGPRQLPVPPVAPDLPPPFLDVNGDDRLSAIDALLVINFINNALQGAVVGEFSKSASPGANQVAAALAMDIALGDLYNVTDRQEEP